MKVFFVSIAIVITNPLVPDVFAQGNKKFPEIHITDWIVGNPGDIGTWGDGKTYVIELWGTWCKPCIENIPHLSALQKKYKEKGLVVIGYSWEDPGKVRQFTKKMNGSIDYLMVNDKDEVTIKYLAEKMEWVESFPYSFVIDKNGSMVWRGNPSAGLGQFIARHLN